jgi:hypothetical protein
MDPSRLYSNLIQPLPTRSSVIALLQHGCCACENEAVGNIHKRSKNVYGDDAIDRSDKNESS